MSESAFVQVPKQPAFPTWRSIRLQRKRGGTPAPTGECDACKRKRQLQTKLSINQSGDYYEQEADRVAEAVVGGPASKRPSISSLGSGGAGAVQREEPAKPKTEEEKYKYGGALGTRTK